MTSQTETPAPVLDANGDPVPIEPPDSIYLWFAGRVPAPGCLHYIAASEARAGYIRCERCERCERCGGIDD